MSEVERTFNERIHDVFLKNKDKWLSSAYVASQVRGHKDSVYGGIWVLEQEGVIKRTEVRSIMPSMTLRKASGDQARWLYKYEKPYQSKYRGKRHAAGPVTRTTFTRPHPAIKTSNKLVTLARDVLEGDMDSVDIAMELLDLSSELKAHNQ